MNNAPVYLQGRENVKENVGVKKRPAQAGERSGAGGAGAHLFLATHLQEW